MKTKVTILMLLFGTIASAQSFKWIYYNETDELLGAVWVDPIIGEPEFQTGIELEGKFDWFFVRGGMSYANLDPEYIDWNVNVGTKFHLLNIDFITYSVGGRGGVEFREGNPNPFLGLVAGVDFDLTRDKSFKIGLRAWVDHRESQKDEFYGDSDAYKPGIIFTSPLTQENGAIVFTFKIL